MLYIVYAESASYAGYGQHFVVEAADFYAAHELAMDSATEYFREQDEDQLLEDDMDCEGYYAEILKVDEFGPKHPFWNFYHDSSQAEFYTKVNI